jgi:hypothetical protein
MGNCSKEVSLVIRDGMCTGHYYVGERKGKSATVVNPARWQKEEEEGSMNLTELRVKGSRNIVGLPKQQCNHQTA